MPIRVLIADDDPVVRRRLSTAITAAGLKVVVEAGSVDEAVARGAELRPDVVVVDIRLHGADGGAAVGEISRAVPGARTIALSACTSDETVVSALRAGAVGVLVKDATPDQLVAAIRSAHEGGFVASADVAHQMLHLIADAPLDPREPLAAHQAVSERELDVIALVARGLTNAEIARELYLAEATVKSHLRRVMLRWNVRDRTQLLIRAVRAGLVSLA